jgi:hypothetical protein
VRADPFGGIDGALLQRLVDVGARQLLRGDAELGDDGSGKAADAHLQALQVVDGVDLLAEPAAHLGHGVAGEQPVDVVLGVEGVHQRLAAAIQPPGILHAAVEAERHGAAEGERRVRGVHVVGGRVAGFDRAARDGIGDFQGGDLRVSPGDGPDLELAVGRLRHQPHEVVGAALQRIERLGPARRHAPPDLRRRLGNGRAAIALVAVPAPATPAAFRNLRRSMLAMTADLLEGTRERQVARGESGDVDRHAPLGFACWGIVLAPCAHSLDLWPIVDAGANPHSRSTSLLAQW